MGAFDDDFAAVEETFAEAFGTTITITAGSSTIEDVTAQVSLQKYETVDSYDVRQTVVSRDYLVAAADLLIDDVQVEPQRGWRITETVSGTEQMFELLPIDRNQCWQPADVEGRQLILHTKKVG